MPTRKNLQNTQELPDCCGFENAVCLQSRHLSDSASQLWREAEEKLKVESGKLKFRGE